MKMLTENVKCSVGKSLPQDRDGQDNVPKAPHVREFQATNVVMMTLLQL